MLERETEQIIGVLRQRTIGSSPAISLKEILASDIPQPVMAFFRCDVEAMLYDEHQAALRATRFNYEHPDTRSALSALHSSLVLHFTFTREAFLERLSDSVHLLANFLVRPQWTLAGVVFEKESTISATALKRLLDYFSPYEYLKTVLFRYAGDKQIGSFTREDFSGLLFRIDSAFLRRKTGAEICTALGPMYDFFDYPRNTGKNALPVKALIRFFEDKGLTDVHTRLEGELAKGVPELDLQGLTAILEDVRRTAGEFRVEKIEKKDTEQVGLSPGSGSAEEPAAGAKAGKGTHPPAQHQAHIGEATPGKTAGPPAGAGVKAGQRAPLDIAGAIGESEKRKFIRKIFKQDDEKFDEAIGHLGRLRNWKEASRHIDEIFILNDVDPYTAEAERFIEIVFKQYHPSR